MAQTRSNLSASSPVWREELSEARELAARRRCVFIRAVLESKASHFILHARGRPFVIQPLTSEYRPRAVRAYRAIWYYADAYREVWTEAEASSALDNLSQCFVAVDELDDVVALAGGRPLRKHDDSRVWANVTDPDRAFYFSELGRVPAAAGTRVGACLFALVMLTAINAGYNEFVLTTAKAADILSPDTLNSARKLYESHGYQLLCDQDGNVLGQSCPQMRANGQMLTDWRPCYYTTAKMFLEKLRLGTT